jgi:DNA-binding NtrC family response regulator
MKANVLLIANRDICSNEVVATAVAQTGRGLQHAKSSREAYQILSVGLEDIEVVIIDLDPGLRSLSILEAISLCKAPPVIVIAGMEKSDMTPIAYRHRGVACINKPFNATELASVIDDVCLAMPRRRAASCDLWGHPRPIRNQMSQQAQSA